MMHRSISQIFTPRTPQANLKLQEEEEEEIQQQLSSRGREQETRGRETAMFSTLQGRRPMIQTPSQTNQASSKSSYTQAQQQTITYLPPRKPRTQIEAMPPSASQPPCLQMQLAEFVALQKQMSRDPALRHPMFFTERMVKKAPNGVVVGEGVGRGYIFEEERVKEGGRASL